MEYLSEAQAQILREQFPSIADLRNQVHVTYWSEQHLVTQELLDLLPFSRVLSATAFYHYTDFQLDDLVAEAQRNLVLWALTGVHQYNGTLVNQLSLFHDDTFLWHDSAPPVAGALRSESASQWPRCHTFMIPNTYSVRCASV